MSTTPATDPPPRPEQCRSDARPEAGPTPCNRREFLKRGAGAVGAGVATLFIGEGAWGQHEGAATTAPAATATSGRPEALNRAYDWTKHDYVYLVDLRKCIGCGSCVRACSRENDVPEGYFRTWVERYQVSRTGETSVDSVNGGKDGFEPLVTGSDVTKAFFFPKLCCHCTHTPCVQLCPVGASFRTEDGVILVDEDRCIGCGYCVQACPYGSRFIHPETHVASKCTLCYHRISKGLTTACVQACPVGARMLGDTKQVGDAVAQIIATERVQILQPELLTMPNCYYLGLTKEAR
ncbi:MAG: 4Fe-4S dicluster domain-containing protein [bacterium]|nr:4Fe-4S dicluster domain-containing protein [bacterium]